MRALKYIGALHGNDARAWFLTIVRHTFYDWCRRNRLAEIARDDGTAVEMAIDDAAIDGADGSESVSNSHGFRLRHAYGSLGNLLAGQTWTNFMNPASLPDTVEFGGPVGQIFDRQAQVRWSQSFGGPGSIASGQSSVGLENPETVAQIPGCGSFRADDDRLPDVTGQVLFNTSIGKISGHGLVRQIRVDSASAPAVVDQKLGGAVSVAGVIPSVGKDDFRFTASA